MLRALIIDDEVSARADLRAMLAAHREIEIVGEASTMKSAREQLARPDYDVVFLDIHIVGGTGFDLLPFVRTAARVIFVTGHDNHALRAFEVNALDYVLKPVNAARLATSVARLAKPPESAPIENAFHDDDLIHLHSGTAGRFAALRDLSAIESQENYSLVHLADGSRILVRRSLKRWAELLPAKDFVRVHRTTIVNLRHIASFRREGPKSILLTVNGVSAPVPVSRDEWGGLKERLPGKFASV